MPLLSEELVINGSYGHATLPPSQQHLNRMFGIDLNPAIDISARQISKSTSSFAFHRTVMV